MFYTNGGRLWKGSFLNKGVYCSSSMGHRIWQWKRKNRNWKKKSSTTSHLWSWRYLAQQSVRENHAQRSKQREEMRQRNSVVWHNVHNTASQYFGHLVGHKNSDCHQICPFYSRTVRQLHLLVCQMQCWSVCTWETLCSCFQKWQIHIFKATFQPW